MSVAAAIMEERPLLNSFDKMSKQYEQNLHVVSGVGGGGGNGGGAAPPSGPASPTPSGSEEPSVTSHAYHHHVLQQHQQLQPPQQQQQQQPQFHHRHHSTLVSTVLEQQQLLVPTSSSNNATTTASSAAEVEAVQRQRLLEDEIQSLKVEQTRLTQQCADAQRREKILTRRLANKEQEFQDYVNQIAEYKAAQAPSAVALRTALLDPAVNLLFEKLQKELKATKAKLEETQNELSAWKFTPDSNTGKRLMAKCRLLYQENEELGKMTSSGRLAKLETELAMQKSFSEEVKKSQSELDDFLQELDEDVEGMQSTILYLQQELKNTRDRIQLLEKENYQLKSGVDADGDGDGDVDGDKPLAADEHIATVITPLPVSLPLNGNSNSVDAMPFINSNQQPQYAPTPATATPILNSNELPKYQGSTLGVIAEDDDCLHSSTQNDYYNGNSSAEDTVAATAVTTSSVPSSTTIVAPTLVIDEASSSSANGKFRTAASRKRNYDCTEAIESCNVNANLPLQQMAPASPRTLPPKKSKLRVTLTRCTSAQSLELKDNGSNPLGTGVVAAGDNFVGIVDNAVAGMANEEMMTTTTTTLGAGGDDVAGAGGAAGAQRIMTRRRSVRTQQQNGAPVGMAGGDSNH